MCTQLRLDRPSEGRSHAEIVGALLLICRRREEKNTQTLTIGVFCINDTVGATATTGSQHGADSLDKACGRQEGAKTVDRRDRQGQQQQKRKHRDWKHFCRTFDKHRH